ncbi:MAG TPA: holo-ACP synthase [Atribacteraceae bacterium]|nr:holo-ACP synthase [Atribacteraceae bacterium]
MMEDSVLYIGIDLVEKDRIERVLTHFEDRFLERLFTFEEIDYYRKGTRRRFCEGVAAIFAAKEAVKKILLQTGIKPLWKSIEIRHDSDGHPWVSVPLEVRKVLSDIQLSLSHTGNLVVAMAVGVLVKGRKQA